MRKFEFTNGEYYHIFNRGNNKRPIFIDDKDFSRFFQSMIEFNTIEPIGSIFINSFRKKSLRGSTSKLVEFVCYCLNPNHYHFILKQLVDEGVQKFIHRIATGYTRHFNEKHDYNGSLFQGRYKAAHINSNEYLLHLSAYVNLNDRVHSLRGSTSKSSWDEYVLDRGGFCKKGIILNQFKSVVEYKQFAGDSLKVAKERKDMEKFLLE